MELWLKQLRNEIPPSCHTPSEIARFELDHALPGVSVKFLRKDEWKDGYETAKEHYNNWSLGFDEGFDSARKRFANYDEGFGDGFETGWNAALECHDQEESE